MNEAHIPGLSACMVDSGRVVWNGNYGYANLETKKQVTDQSLFMMASVSKIVTTAAIGKLLEMDKIDLDSDINDYLTFKVVNTKFPNIPITIRQLLRHSSSIIDNKEYLAPFWSNNKGDPTIELKSFLEEYLIDSGENYNREKNFSRNKPGTHYTYSNIGFSLLGLIVEKVSDQPFDV